ncbi:MAG: stage II sporulation protein P [Oscillospiraceae bacterium]|nr:stage II sporulation protein P [Oscillospiraceae bacterium]
MDRRWRLLGAAVLAAYGLCAWAALDELSAAGTPSPHPAGEAPVPCTAAPVGEEAAVPLFPEAEIRLKNDTSFAPDLSALLREPLTQTLPEEGAQILIIHTHGTEAFLPVSGEEYTASDPYRTTEAEHSVIRLGDELRALWEAQGFRVIHDRSLYDYPSYTGAYSRSREAVEGWLARCPDIALVIDLHRDAAGEPDSPYRSLAKLEGEPTAQVMLVVGTGENGLSHPLWRENLKLALVLQAAAEEACPGLMRPIALCRERYNQHLTTGSLILEVGSNGNTLSEAERAVERFAAAAVPVLRSLAG